MARERFNRGSRRPQKKDKLIRQTMATHEARLPTLPELYATLDGIDNQCLHGQFDETFGVDTRDFENLDNQWHDRD